MTPSPHILIVGAGPGGALLAYLLARRGIHVTLLERQHDFAREFRGEVLMPSGLDMLWQAGLTEAFRQVPQLRFERLAIYWHTRRLFGVRAADLFKSRAGSGPLFTSSAASGPLITSQPAMLEMLVAAAGRYPNFTLERGVSVGGPVIEGGRVVGVRAAGHEEREWRGDLVVGADGRFSVLRERSGLQEAHIPQFFDVLWCKVPMPAFMTETARGYLGNGHMALMFKSYEDQLQVGWIIAKGAFGDLRKQGPEAWLADLAHHVSPDMAAHLIAHREDIAHPFLLNVVCDRLEHWTAPGLLLIGDAAHPMSPVGGQGLNMALRDAVVAHNHLAPVLLAGGGPAALDEAAARAEAERLPETLAIQELQQTPPGLLFADTWRSKLTVDVIAPLFFPMLVPLLARTGVLSRLTANNLQVFLNGVTPVHLDS